ncbi:ABC transporter permease [Paenibacillus eucommiae]|uniref:Aldouronate transport system permease protein n=1 Tax=Paenibacillus eucommiae TaxID=1355755 RepID=A0ABS4IVU1_9BACL|nr:ABC transporter permease subunit [Paenibacillus eucommiae]MBP1991699.1 putative aldouronate transport system permease protein [Paenibacillus eucommiae]
MKAELVRNRWLYAMLLPGIVFFIIFKYVPIWGLIISFQNYHPFLGVWGSEWVGFDHFVRFFHERSFWMLLRNTFVLALYNIVFFFPFPIVLALLLNEVRFRFMKRFVQSVLYIPHFISWVVVVGICYMLFSIQDGIVPYLMEVSGIKTINFLQSSEWFRFMITSQVIWKESGWSAIIFLAAMSSVDPQAYEAATIDGAGRMRKIWHVTLPAIRSTIVILLIIRLGSFLDVGFEQIFLMVNSVNRQVGEVFDTYVYTVAIQQGNFSYSTAVGLFKSVVGALLVYMSNLIARKYGEDGIF